MASPECILCLLKIEKKGDVNLVEGKRDFNIKAEIESLHFVVRPISRHICRSCLGFLKHRANQRKKLDEINSKLLLNYQEKALEKRFTVKLKSSAKRLEYGDVDCSNSAVELPLVIEQGDAIFPCSPIYPVSSLPIQATSTPRRISTCRRITNTQSPPQELPHEISGQLETVVKVTIVWNSKTSTRVLPDDLNSLGKMMCRGTYTQIARAAWRNGKIREKLISFFLKEIDKECCNMCSSKYPSLLRKTARKDILNFSITKLDEEIKRRTPLLRSVLMSASVRKTKIKRSDLYWMPAICMAAAICLKNRSPQMTALQLLNSLFIQHSGLMVSIIMH